MNSKCGETGKLGPQEAPEPPLHLRVFRSVALHDADMLIPGAVARFTLLDKLLIWVPILIGVASAIYKIATSSLTFNPRADPVAFATTLALVLMPLSYAAQARASVQRKADDYKADIDELLLMRQRSSNAGALQWLLDTAAEQEQKEMLLAYTFLWGGLAVPRPVSRDEAKRDVDAAIERFLHADILRAEHGDHKMAAVDFDMADALSDVVREGLVCEIGAGDTLQAMPIREAVDVMSIRNYPEQPAYVPEGRAPLLHGTPCEDDAGRGSQAAHAGAEAFAVFGGSAVAEALGEAEQMGFAGPVRSGSLPPQWLRHGEP